MYIRYRVLQACLALATLSVTPLPVWALPGHNIAQEHQWANQNNLLLQLQESKDPEGNSLYTSERKTAKGSVLRFVAKTLSTNPQIVYSESISIFAAEEELRGKNIAEYFQTNHRKIFAPLVKALYGTALELDYDTLDLDIHQTEKNRERYFYRGRKYNYVMNWINASPECKGNCKAVFELTIYDFQVYQKLVEAEKARQKSQPVDINLFN